MSRLIRIPLSAHAGERGGHATGHLRRSVYPAAPGSRGGVSLNEAKRRRGDDEIARPFEFSIGRDEIMRLTPCKIGPL